MRTKKTTKPAPILAASSNGDSKSEKASKLPTTNGKAGQGKEQEEDPSDSIICINDNDSLVNGNAEKADGSDSDEAASSSGKANDKAGSTDGETKEQKPAKVIRLVSIEKLLRPSLLPTPEEETSKKKSSQKQSTIEKPASKRAKDASVIEISDTETEDDDKPLSKKLKTKNDDVVQNLSSSDDEIVPIKKKVSQKAKKASKKLIDDDEDEEDDDDKPVVKRQVEAKAAKQSKQKMQPAKVPEGCKSFSLRVEKLPSDLKPLMKELKLSGILDRRNREITSFKANTNHYGDLRRPRNASGAGSSKSKAQVDGKKSKSSKSQVIPSSESDSDEPIASIVSKSDNIPKNKTMSKRSARSKRQLSESDDDGDSDFEIKTTGKSKATSAQSERRGRGRPRKRKVSSAEEEEDDDEENGDGGGSESDEFEEEKPQPKKKRSRIKKVSSSSSEDDDGNKIPATSASEPKLPNEQPNLSTTKPRYLTVLDKNGSDKVHPAVSSPSVPPVPEESENLQDERSGLRSTNPPADVPVSGGSQVLHPPPKDLPNSDVVPKPSHDAIVAQLQQYILAQNRQIEELTRENRKLRAAVPVQQTAPSQPPPPPPNVYQQLQRGTLRFYSQQANGYVRPIVRVVVTNAKPK